MKLLALYEMADRDNIVIDCFELGKREALSVRDDTGYCCIAIDHTKLKDLADETYKLGHEIGHCKTGSFYSRSCPLQTMERCEWRAEKWAICHLIPREELRQCFRHGYTEPWEIAEQMNLPEPFVIKAMEYYYEQDLANEKIRPRLAPEADHCSL